MNRKAKVIVVFTVVVAVACFVASGCAGTKASRGSSVKTAKVALSPEDRWSEPVNLWNLNTERENKRPYISLDGNTLYLGGASQPGYMRVAKWTGTGTGWSDPIEEKVEGPGRGSTLMTLDGKLCVFVGKGLTEGYGSSRPDLPKWGQGDADLYYATREDNHSHWSEPINLGPEVNSPGVDALPSITAKGDAVYFWSVAREGNFGKEDIWRTRRAGNAWQKAEHLGPQVNTVGDEYCPWISPDGHVLYFGATRSTGQGVGQHIWMCHIDNNGVPDDPVVLDSKFNVPGYSSCCVTMSLDGKRLVYASTRPGGKGDWDLWMVTRD